MVGASRRGSLTGEGLLVHGTHGTFPGTERVLRVTRVDGTEDNGAQTNGTRVVYDIHRQSEEFRTKRRSFPYLCKELLNTNTYFFSTRVNRIPVVFRVSIFFMIKILMVFLRLEERQRKKFFNRKYDLRTTGNRGSRTCKEESILRYIGKEVIMKAPQQKSQIPGKKLSRVDVAQKQKLETVRVVNQDFSGSYHSLESTSCPGRPHRDGSTESVPGKS